jgi:NAD(P)H-hydrate repair Nnr-like enzyme with NAD(P)H-hydrate dehydratase domain
MLISQGKKLFVNPYGSAKLSKGGSGDVLSGLISALLAQGYSALDAAISGSLALTQTSELYSGSSYSILPTDLIKLLSELQ